MKPETLILLAGLAFAAPLADAQTQDHRQTGRLTRRVAADAGNTNAPLLFCIGVHIEPFGASVSKLAGGAALSDPERSSDRRAAQAGAAAAERFRPDYHERRFFDRHVADLRELARVVERHGGKLTIQAQTPFTTVAAESGETVLRDLERRGHEIALHFHEDAHLGRNSEQRDIATWAAVMREEIEAIRRAGVTNRIRYWSGGNLYPGVLEAAAQAGLDVMSDHKNPRRQQTDARLLGVHPWRPAGGPSAENLDAFARHDSAGKIIYLPDGKFSRVDHAGMRRSEQLGGDWRYFDFLTEGLELSLRAAQPDRVNVFHITVHPGEFRGRDGEPFAVMDAWLREIVAPLVQAGKVRWATFSEMAEAYARWEKSGAGAAARPQTTAVVANESQQPSAQTASSPAATAAQPDSGVTNQAFITFAVNCHDWRFVDESADTLLRLIGIFERHGVRGDFYLTAPLVERYREKRPEVVERLKASRMTISYHVRAPHPLWRGFSQPLAGKEGAALAEALRDYETFQLDLRTGGLNRGRPGGYRFVEQVFGRKPVAVGASDAAPEVRSAAWRVYADLGARVGVLYHETGTKLEQPFEWRDGLLVRPSDFSVTRFSTPNHPRGVFWWAMMGSAREAEFDPLVLLQQRLREWRGGRAPFVTALIHENDFYREGGPGWNSIYFEGDGPRSQPRRPPFDLDTPPGSRARPAQVREAIFAKYEGLVAYAAQNLKVVTSEDVAELARSSAPASDAAAPMRSDAAAGPAQRRFSEPPARTEANAPQFDTVFVRIPSSAAGTEGVAARILIPRQPRFTNGAPVVVNVPGGVQATQPRARPEYVGLGFVEIHFAFPGGGLGEERSGGTYDFRGPNCIRALADVIRFAIGRLADQQGRRLGELARDFAVLTNNVGLVGSSHGGNTCGSAMALHGEEFPNLAWYASMESPYSEGAANVELGGRDRGPNPAYDPKTGAVDLSKLAWSPELVPGLARRPMFADSPPLQGAFYFDLNGDGRFSRDADFPCNCFVADVGSGVKAWYSPRILAEAETRQLIRGPRPAHVPTLAEAREFCRYRDAAPHIPEAVRRCPKLAVIVYANERDHVQADPAHTHILEQVEGFQKAGARFVRLNPDRAYVEHVASAGPLRPRGVSFADNPAGKRWTRADIVQGLEPEGLPAGVYMQAAVAELADRTQAGNWAANLDGVLFTDAPRPAPLTQRPPAYQAFQ